MEILNKEKLSNYVFDRQTWGPGGGHLPEIVAEWERRLNLLLEGLPCEATVDPGYQKVGWGPVLQLRLGQLWPYAEEIPIVRFKSFVGLSDRAIQTLTGFRIIEEEPK